MNDGDRGLVGECSTLDQGLSASPEVLCCVFNSKTLDLLLCSGLTMKTSKMTDKIDWDVKH